MTQITIKQEKFELNNSTFMMWVIRRDNGKKLGEFKTELTALQKAWELVKQYGLVLVEPW